MNIKTSRIPDACDLTVIYGEEDQHSPTDMFAVKELIEQVEY